MKLTHLQQQLIDYLSKGGRIKFLPSNGTRSSPQSFWITDHNWRCSQQVEGLLKRGYLKLSRDKNTATLSAKAQTKTTEIRNDTTDRMEAYCRKRGANWTIRKIEKRKDGLFFYVDKHGWLPLGFTVTESYQSLRDLGVT